MNINKSKLLEEIKINQNSIEFNKIHSYLCYTQYQSMANSYLYLNDIDKYFENTKLAINELNNHILNLESKNRDSSEFLRLKCCYLWFGQYDTYKNIALKLMEIYANKMNNTDISFLKTNKYPFCLSEMYFMLGEYQKCSNLLNIIDKRENPLYACNISKAIIENDICSLSKISKNIEKNNHQMHIGTGDTGMNIYIWYYYEVCLKYLGLPNKIDDIYNYKHGIIKNHVEIKESLQDISIQEWCITLIQTVEVSSEISMNKNFFRIKDLKSLQNLIEPTQFKIIMDNTVEKKLN